MPLAAGTKLGPYEILAPIGAGGMGEIYRAKDARLEREVAIKVLPEHLAKDTGALTRFEREAKAVAALSHPNILALFDVGSEQGISFAVTELLEGETLRSRLAMRLPWSEAVQIGVAIADGLAAAHSKGIIHRDLKPENIFLTSDGRVKILDFGLARMKSAPASSDETAPLSETREGTVMGTVGYMAPEQVRGERVDAPGDIFSLGCILYEMSSGQRAFSRETAAQTMAAILETQPPDLPGSGRQIPAELTRVVIHCLEKHPRQRFQSAQDLAFALRAISGSGSSSSTREGRRRVPRLAWVAGGLAVLLAAAAVYWNYGTTRPIASLAVLPFANVGANPDTEYLSDGITENLINSLSQLPNLRVVPRSLAFANKGKEVDPRKVGRDLNVGAVLMGRVVQRGDSLNIQAELVDVENVSQLWGQQYNRKLSDIIVIQEEISKAVAQRLGLRPSGEDEKRLTRRYTQNPEAHQLYLRGRYLWNRRTAQTLRRAAEYFQQAIEKDPGYALAWAGLADAYNVYSFYRMSSPKDSATKAREAARKALELDDTLAEAHASIAYGLRQEWDWVGAEREFQRAIALNPDYPTAHMWYGTTLSALGRQEESMRELRRAQETDPLSLIINAEIGRQFYFARQYDQAIEHFRKTIDEMDPNFGVAHYYLGLALEERGRYQEAIEEFQKWFDLSAGDPAAIAALAHAYGASGNKSEAQKRIAQLHALSKSRYVAPVDLAVAYIGLGDKDRSMEWLEKAYEDRSAWLIWIKVDPRFDVLHADPRFRDLLRRMGL